MQMPVAFKCTADIGFYSSRGIAERPVSICPPVGVRGDDSVHAARQSDLIVARRQHWRHGVHAHLIRTCEGKHEKNLSAPQPELRVSHRLLASLTRPLCVYSVSTRFNPVIKHAVSREGLTRGDVARGTVRTRVTD